MFRTAINKKISVMASEFEAVASQLFKITKPMTTFEFEKGVYGSIFVKPIKRVQKIFSTDREVLVLLTNFSDQQQRTIGAIEEQLSQTPGRLEGTLVIVVHTDPDGNSKLKNWGREKGIAILPIAAHASMPDRGTFERDLLQDFFSNDPFDVTGPVSDDARFFGRRAEALDISRQLQSGQIRACLGIRKIGKTSILNRVLHEAKTNHRSACIMIDCSKDDIWGQSAAQLLFAIGDSIITATADSNRYTEVVACGSEQITLAEARSRIIAALKASNDTIIIFFDEVDYITPGSPTAGERWTNDFNPFWRNLRAVVQESVRIEKKLSLFVGGVSSKWFKAESINGVENAALAFIPEEYLSPLASPASAAMIRTLAKVAGLTFDERTAEWIGDACGNMPYWTRKACSYIHRNVDIRERPCLVPQETAERLVRSFVEVEGAAVAEVALNHLFRVHPDVHAPALSVLNGENRSTREPIIATLLRYGILSEKSGRVHFGSLMIESGMRLYNSKSVQDGVAKNSEEKPVVFSPELRRTLDEWADELALINASRNKLEKRLRSLALNFIKFSALQNKGSGSPTERIQKAVEKSRLERLKHLPADDLIEKLLWSELVRLIEKNWELFTSIFNDLRLFKLHAEVINDRYDAHAKDADGADLAYYRKSLRWVEEAVQRAST
jgi:hypothetical protein